MSGCDFCDAEGVDVCEQCGAWCCRAHRVVRATHGPRWAGGSEVLCNPDPATHPGAGCYRPPITEVRDDS